MYSYHVNIQLRSLKCQKWLIVVISADGSKGLVTVWEQYLNALEKEYEFLQKIVIK